VLALLIFSISYADTYYYEYGKKVKLTKLKDQRSDLKDVEYYKYESGRKVGVKKEVLVKCKNMSACKDIFKEHNLTKYRNLTPSIVLITLNKEDDPFEISQKLYEEEDIEYSHPNFVKKRQKR
jgi:hypothetical protein